MIADLVNALTTLAAVITAAACIVSGMAEVNWTQVAAGVLLLQAEYIRNNSQPRKGRNNERRRTD